MDPILSLAVFGAGCVFGYAYRMLLSAHRRKAYRRSFVKLYRAPLNG